VASDQENIELLQREVERQRVLIDNLYRHLGIGQLDELSDGPPQDVVDAIRAGNLIQAIKHYREHTGEGLAESKAAVEEIARRL
jgi:ribosomal protein L7/L12